MLNPPYHYIVDTGTLEDIQDYIDSDIDTDDVVRRFVVAAADLGRLDVIKYLLGKYQTSTDCDELKTSALWTSVMYDLVDIVSYVCSLKPNLECKFGNGKSALVMASESNYLEVVDLLLASGANPNTPDKSGNTALLMAVRYDNQEVVKLLLRHGADSRKKNRHGKNAIDQAKLRNRQVCLDLMEQSLKN